MKKERLTNRQFEVLMAIEEFIDTHNYPPSIRELCRKLNLKSPATVHEHLRKLKEKGYIYYVEKKFRTIRVLKVKL